MWRATLAACKRVGGEVSQLVIVQPATEHEVASVEAQLGMRLPESFRDVLLQFSARVEFWWSLPDDAEPPIESVFSGGCCWDLAALPEIEQRRRGLVEGRFSNADDPYSKVWHDKLAFFDVENGDQLAFDLHGGVRQPITYLSYEGGEGHSYLLGHDFADFVDRWTLLGCPGPEDWQVLSFLSSPTSALDPHSQEATQWRQWLGLTIDAV
jgi:SMI1 / KNR4 family (SUKH-1)